MLVDRARIFIQSGKGGNGAVTFRREPYVPEGGPDGGDGGRGGSVIFQADHNIRTLADFRYKTKYQAQDGQNGMKRNRFGKAGEDLVIKVPPGTLIIDEESGLTMKDLKEDGQTLVAAKGGRGGRGNVRFKNSRRQAPNFAEAGEEGRARTVILEMKMLADVGLVGFPNAGKSSLLAAATGARPKIADYPFTTIDPNLGVVELRDTSFVMADIAGLIEGASQGLGLGFRFLKHIERTKVLIHVVDVSGSEGRDPIEDFEKINAELAAYSPRILQKPQLVAANKTDLIDEADPAYQAFVAHVTAQGYRVFPICAPLGVGVEPLLLETLAVLSRQEAEAAAQAETEEENFSFEPDAPDPDYRTIHAGYDEEAGVYTLAGKQLTKIFNSTNFHDLGSLRYLYKYLEKRGAIRELKKMGLEEGDIIRIMDYDLEYWDEY